MAVDLLGLLKWKEVLDNSKALTRHLNHLMKEEGEEIVKVCLRYGEFACLKISYIFYIFTIIECLNFIYFLYLIF